MNKKFLKAAAITVCAATCASAFALSAAGCGGGEVKAQSYYNKTITFTGKAYTYGFDTVGEVDNYNEGKNDGNGERDTTQRKILEKYWNDIDWKYTGLDPAPKDSDEVKTFLDTAQTKVFEDMKDLSFTVTKTDTVTITLNLNEEFEDLGWGTSMTIPLYESDDEFKTSTGIEPWFTGLKEGYFGAGVKVDGNKRIRVSIDTRKVFVDVGGKKNVYKDTVGLSIVTETIEEGGAVTQNSYLSTDILGSGTFYGKEEKIDEIATTHRGILYVGFYPEITITDAE